MRFPEATFCPAALGNDLLVGLVLHTGQDTLALGPKNRAMPISVIREHEA